MYAKNLIDAFNRFSDRAFHTMLMTLVATALLPGLLYLRIVYGTGQNARKNLNAIGVVSGIVWIMIFGLWTVYG